MEIFERGDFFPYSLLIYQGCTGYPAFFYICIRPDIWFHLPDNSYPVSGQISIRYNPMKYIFLNIVQPQRIIFICKKYIVIRIQTMLYQIRLLLESNLISKSFKNFFFFFILFKVMQDFYLKIIFHKNRILHLNFELHFKHKKVFSKN